MTGAALTTLVIDRLSKMAGDLIDREMLPIVIIAMPADGKGGGAGLFKPEAVSELELADLLEFALKGLRERNPT